MSDKVSISYIIYGPTADETKVILSNGDELTNLEMVSPQTVSNDMPVCRVGFVAILDSKVPIRKKSN